MLRKRRAERLEVLTSFVPLVFKLTVTIDHIVIELLESKAEIESDVWVTRGILG